MLLLIRRACLILLFALSTLAPAFAQPTQAGQSGTILGKRGMSVAWLHWSPATLRSAQPYDVNQTLWTDSSYRKLRGSGVDFVRGVTPPQPLMADDPIARARAIAQLGSNVDRVLLTGLKIIVDLHFWPPGDVTQMARDTVQNPASRARFIRGEVQLAAELARRPQGSVALELMNEPWPCGGTGDGSWPGLQSKLVAEIRKVAPRLPLVVTGCTGAVDSLVGLDVAGYVQDPNILYTFHFYEPFVFTHQFIFSGGAVLNNVPFPAPRVGVSEGMVETMVPSQAAQLSPGARAQVRDYVRKDQGIATIAARFAQIGQWTKRNRIPPQRVLLGEFGVPFPLSPKGERLRADRLRWTLATRLSAERQGFAWCFWINPREGNLDFDPAARFVRSDMLQALGLAQGVKP